MKDRASDGDLTLVNNAMAPGQQLSPGEWVKKGADTSAAGGWKAITTQASGSNLLNFPEAEALEIRLTRKHFLGTNKFTEAEQKLAFSRSFVIIRKQNNQVVSAKAATLTLKAGENVSVSGSGEGSTGAIYLKAKPTADKVGSHSVVEYLLPFEIVTPKEDSTSEGYSGDLVTATNLKVAKMELSLDENHMLKLDKDPDRFFVRIPGGAQLGGGSVTISTKNPDSGYDDNATRLRLVVDGNDLRSSSLILVADEKDDDYPGGSGVGVDDSDENEDRTHLVQLGGTVKLETLTLGGQAHSLDITVPVKPKKRLTATILYLGAAKDSKNQLARSLKIVSERYAQVGIEINLIEHDLPVPPGVDSNGIQTDAVGNVVPSDVKAIFDSVPNEFRNEVMIIVAPDIRVGVGIAYTLRGGGSNGTDAAYRNKGVVSARKIVQNQRLYTIAHELGHILTNHYHFGQDYPTTTTGPVYEDSDHRVVHNLLRGGETSADEEIGASKRLYQMQENMFQNNLLEEVD